MAAFDEGPLSKYNSLTDRHLSSFFSNDRRRRHLVKSGLITKTGEVVSDSMYRVKIARKDHRRHVRDLIAQAIVHKALEMERSRQIDIRKKIEEISKVELVRRVRTDRSRVREDDYLTYFNQEEMVLRTRSAKSGSRSRKSHVDMEGSDHLSRPKSDKTAPGDQTTMVDTKHLSQVDSLTLAEYARILDRYEHKMNNNNKLPCLGTTGSGDSLRNPSKHPLGSRPHGEKPKRLRGSLKSEKESLSVGGLGPPQSARLAQSTGPPNPIISILFNAPSSHRSFEVMVHQQPSGGNTLVVYKDNICKGAIFQLTSHRHRGFPFSLTFYIDGVKDSRISTCCEYKHKVGKRIGGSAGHFSLSQVDGGVPCFKCLAERDLERERKENKDKHTKEIEPCNSRPETISIRSTSEDPYKSDDDFESDHSLKSVVEKREESIHSPQRSESPCVKEVPEVEGSIREKTPEIEVGDPDTVQEPLQVVVVNEGVASVHLSVDESEDGKTLSSSYESSYSSDATDKLPPKKNTQNNNSSEEEVNRKLHPNKKFILPGDGSDYETSSSDEKQNGLTAENKPNSFLNKVLGFDSDSSISRSNVSETRKSPQNILEGSNYKKGESTEFNKEKLENGFQNNIKAESKDLREYQTEENHEKEEIINVRKEENHEKEGTISVRKEENHDEEGMNSIRKEENHEKEKSISARNEGNNKKDGIILKDNDENDWSISIKKEDNEITKKENDEKNSNQEILLAHKDTKEVKVSNVVSPRKEDDLSAGIRQNNDDTPRMTVSSSKNDSISVSESRVSSANTSGASEDDGSSTSEIKQRSSRKNIGRKEEITSTSSEGSRSLEDVRKTLSSKLSPNDTGKVENDDHNNAGKEVEVTSEIGVHIFFENDDISFKKAKEKFESIGDQEVSSLIIRNCELPSYIFNFISGKLESKRSLKKIELSGCEVEISLLKLLARSLGRWPSLDSLVLSNNVLVDYSLFDLITTIEEVYTDYDGSGGPSLGLLDISNCSLQENDFNQLITMIASNAHVETIVLDRNPITSSMWQSLRGALRKNVHTKSISVRSCFVEVGLLEEVSKEDHGDIGASLILK